MSSTSNSAMFELDKTKIFKNITIGPKFLLIEKNSNETLQNISPFLIKKVIENVCGEVDMFKKIAAVR